MKRLSFLLLILLLPKQSITSEIKSDEELLLFPSCAYLSGKEKAVINIHIWVYEPGKNRVKRSLLEEGLEEIIKADITPEQKTVFNRRIKDFLVDNERNKDIRISIMGRDFTPGKTGPGGHLFSELIIDDRKIIQDLVKKKRVSCQVKLRKNDTRKYSGFITFIPRKGVSVISDIDDTIKISNVLHRKELIKNTFIRDFRPVKGLSSLYDRWRKKGALFHYVSGSPWQLYLPVSRFLEDSGFPRGFFFLKPFRLKPSAIYHFIKADQLKYKTGIITGIIRKFPGRRYILVGDSGEKDPEVYSRIARRYPDKILFILIRNVTNQNPGSPRYRKLFPRGFPVRWKIFKDASELKERYLTGF